MATRTTECNHQLSGDWTISGVVSQVNSLSQSLQKLESARNKRIHIDCGRIESIDMSGLQLLHVWMELVKMHGVKTELVNLPDSMQQSINRLGLSQSFTDNYPVFTE